MRSNPMFQRLAGHPRWWAFGIVAAVGLAAAIAVTIWAARLVAAIPPMIHAWSINSADMKQAGDFEGPFSLLEAAGMAVQFVLPLLAALAAITAGVTTIRHARSEEFQEIRLTGLAPRAIVSGFWLNALYRARVVLMAAAWLMPVTGWLIASAAWLRVLPVVPLGPTVINASLSCLSQYGNYLQGGGIGYMCFHDVPPVSATHIIHWSAGWAVILTVLVFSILALAAAAGVALGLWWKNAAAPVAAGILVIPAGLAAGASIIAQSFTVFSFATPQIPTALDFTRAASTTLMAALAAGALAWGLLRLARRWV